ncbi:MAG: radical SAM protein [Desulfurococcaceae archaeon]
MVSLVLNRDIIIRLSIGSLSLLKLTNVIQKYSSRTIYILQYSDEGCLAKCKYCFQSKSSTRSKHYLSRISWYPVNLSIVIDKLLEYPDLYDRICIQTILKKDFITELRDILKNMRKNGIDKPVSIALTPVHKSILTDLSSLGVDYLGVGLDASTPVLFNNLSKPYNWRVYWRFIREALSVFGDRHVYVHLIIGLGESYIDLLSNIYELINNGVDVALFPYVDDYFRVSVDPIYYRFIQITRFLLLKGYSLQEILRNFKLRREILIDVMENIDKYFEAFLTTGCPGCNRPYYTENPRGPFYNLYSRDHFREYRDKLVSELERLLKSDYIE